MSENTYRKAPARREGATIARRVRKDGGTKTAATGAAWWASGVVVMLALMLCLTINFRAFSELSGEAAENAALETKIQSFTSENLALQEQIHYLKNDPDVVEREARKFGLRRPQNKVSVQTNK